jgi:hypothetical protein
VGLLAVREGIEETAAGFGTLVAACVVSSAG